MKIETKFDINNLVVSKYQRNTIIGKPDERLCCFEIMDINTGTCMAGTLVYYVCRGVHGITGIDFIDGKKVETFTDFNVGSNSKGEYVTFREDELVEAPKGVIDLVLGNY